MIKGIDHIKKVIRVILPDINIKNLVAINSNVRLIVIFL